MRRMFFFRVHDRARSSLCAPVVDACLTSHLRPSPDRWYNGKIKRIEAEKKLLLAENEHGAFLIRDSESRRNDYSLSVRDGDTVKHYRIRQLDEGGFFIARRTTFRTLPDLVEHYSRDADGLCVNLRKPCVKVGGQTRSVNVSLGVFWSSVVTSYSRLIVDSRLYFFCLICVFPSWLPTRTFVCHMSVLSVMSVDVLSTILSRFVLPCLAIGGARYAFLLTSGFMCAAWRLPRFSSLALKSACLQLVLCCLRCLADCCVPPRSRSP